MRGAGKFLGGRRSPSPAGPDLDEWSTLSEYTEGLVPVDHEAIHGSRLDSSKKQIRLLQIIPRDSPDDYEDDSCNDDTSSYLGRCAISLGAWECRKCTSRRRMSPSDDSPEPVPSPDDRDAADDMTVHCRMFKISLDDFDPQPPLFNALSYTWGSPDNQTNIVINEKTVSVRSNLESALRHLRDYHNDMTHGFPLWIDALCINQEDVEERNAQVNIMGDIYRRAHRVLPWLGEGHIDTDWVITQLKDASFCEEVEQIDLSSPANFTPGPVLARVIAIALQHLLRRPWWSRLWVIQEIVLARRDPILVVGRKSVPWSHYVRMLRRLRPIGPRIVRSVEWRDTEASLYTPGGTYAPMPQLHLESFPGLKADLWGYLRRDLQSEGHCSICSLLVGPGLMLEQSATRGLDYIYALRGLCPEEEQRRIDVDYSKSSMQVFHDAMVVVWTSPYSAEYLANVSEDLDYCRGHLLYAASESEEEAMEAYSEIPSWVPDLSQQRLTTIFTTERDPWRTPIVRISLDKKTLTIRGVYCDAVSETCRVRLTNTLHDGFQYDAPDIGDLRQAFRCMMEALTREPTSSLSSSSSSSPSSYIAFEKRDKDKNMLQTMLAAVSLSALDQVIHDQPRLVRTIWDALVAIQHPVESDSVVISILLRAAEEELRQQQIGLTAPYCVGQFLEALAERLRRNVVFTTEAGSVGVGRGHMKAGDRIVFPFGMACPFVVRPLDPAQHLDTHEYTMIGVAEMPDLSDRERLDKALEDGVLKEVEIHLK